MKKPTKAEIRTFYNSDRAILMFCIGIALIIWVAVKLSKKYTTTSNFEVNYSLPEGKTFIDPPTKIVTATIGSQGWTLINHHFRNKNNVINFDLSSSTSHTLSRGSIIDKIQKNLPKEINVSAVNLDFIDINIEDKAEKKVPVILNTSLEFAPRFHRIDSISLSQDSLTVYGPLSIIEALSEWPTETLSLQNIQNTAIHKVPFVEPENSQITLSVNEIEAEIKVEEFTEKDLFVPVVVKNAPDSLKIFPENIKLSFTLGLSNYNKIKSSDFTVEVDLKNIPLNTTKNTIPLLITRQPSYIRNLIFSPKSVEFFFVEAAREATTSN